MCVVAALGLSGCGGVDGKGAQSRAAQEPPKRSSLPCPRALSAAQVAQLERLLETAELDQRRGGLGWEQAELSVLISERALLMWWWSKAPARGASALPAPPSDELTRGYERCDAQRAWRASGDALWALTSLSARANRASRPRPAPKGAHAFSRTTRVIAACQACEGLEQRHAYGSPLSLSDEATVHIGTLVPLQPRERWVTVRLRAPELDLDSLRNQTCQCH